MKKGNGLYIRNTVFLGIMAAAVIMTGCGKNSDKKEAASDDEKAVVQDTAESTKEETSETEEKESEEENQAEAETVERELTQIADDENCRIKPSGIISNGKNMIVTDTYYKAVTEAAETASDAAMVASITDGAKYFFVNNFGFRNYLFKARFTAFLKFIFYTSRFYFYIWLLIINTSYIYNYA